MAHNTPTKETLPDAVQKFFGGNTKDVHQVTNPDGSPGAWIDKNSIVAPTATTSAETFVFGSKILGGEVIATEVMNSTIHSGVLSNTSLYQSRCFSGSITGGELSKSTIKGGCIENGTLYNSTVHTGEIKDSTIEDSYIYGGKITDSTLKDCLMFDGLLNGVALQKLSIPKTPLIYTDENRKIIISGMHVILNGKKINLSKALNHKDLLLRTLVEEYMSSF